MPLGSALTVATFLHVLAQEFAGASRAASCGDAPRCTCTHPGVRHITCCALVCLHNASLKHISILRLHELRCIIKPLTPMHRTEVVHAAQYLFMHPRSLRKRLDAALAPLLPWEAFAHKLCIPAKITTTCCWRVACGPSAVLPGGLHCSETDTSSCTSLAGGAWHERSKRRSLVLKISARGTCNSAVSCVGDPSNSAK